MRLNGLRNGPLQYRFEMLKHIAQFALADETHHVVGNGRAHDLCFQGRKAVEPILDKRFCDAAEGVAIVEHERAAIKAGLRMQQAAERRAPNDGVSRLQQIKASVRKTEKRRENRL